MVDTFPAWSPDGATIAYMHNDSAGGPDQIWLLELATDERLFLTVGRQPAWHPDGEELTFNRPGYGILSIRPATGKVRTIVGGADLHRAAWSPDGTRLSFGAGEAFTGSADSVGTWVVGADGADLMYFRRGSDATWDPVSGDLLMRLHYPSRTFGELGLVDLGTQEVTFLTSNEWHDASPDFSPDGSPIAWSSGGRTDSGLWLMNADGSDPHLLAWGGARPSWSPDGRRLVYSAYNGAHNAALSDGSHTISLWTVNADGTDPAPLTLLSDYRQPSPSPPPAMAP